jgi:hypothetical protein
LRFEVQGPEIPVGIVQSAAWSVEHHDDGAVLVGKYEGWSEEVRGYAQKEARVDLRGVTPKPVGAGYYTMVPPVHFGTSTDRGR